ncbi:MAG: hypothetical protein PHY30_02470 [Candidatus Pacebacteria bacterium]|nr:hypothetical protein [Candidatus Paceibacterota bacterium]
MGLHDKVITETKDGKRVVINLSDMDEKELALSLEYFLFVLKNVPHYSENIFIKKAELIEETDFLRIINKVIDSDIARTDTKNLLSFLRKIFVANFDRYHFETKTSFVKLHFELLKQADLQEIIKNEFQEWPNVLKNFCKFYVQYELSSEELKEFERVLKK